MTATRLQMAGSFSMTDDMTADLTVKQRPGTAMYDVMIVRKQTQ
jgi:hypothetical protein